MRSPVNVIVYSKNPSPSLARELQAHPPVMTIPTPKRTAPAAVFKPAGYNLPGIGAPCRYA